MKADAFYAEFLSEAQLVASLRDQLQEASAAPSRSAPVASSLASPPTAVLRSVTPSSAAPPAAAPQPVFVPPAAPQVVHKAPPPPPPLSADSAPASSSSAPPGLCPPQHPAPTRADPVAPPSKAETIDLTEPSPWLSAWSAQVAPKAVDMPTPLFGRLRSIPLQSAPPQPKASPWSGHAERRDESAGREASKLQPGFAPSGRQFYPSPQHTETVPPSPAVFSQVGNRTAGPHVSNDQFRVPGTDPHSWLSPTQIQESPNNSPQEARDLRTPAFTASHSPHVRAVDPRGNGEQSEERKEEADFRSSRHTFPKLALEHVNYRNAAEVTRIIETWIQSVEINISTWSLAAVDYFQGCIKEAKANYREWQGMTAQERQRKELHDNLHVGLLGAGPLTLQPMSHMAASRLLLNKKGGHFLPGSRRGNTRVPPGSRRGGTGGGTPWSRQGGTPGPRPGPAEGERARVDRGGDHKENPVVIQLLL